MPFPAPHDSACSQLARLYGNVRSGSAVRWDSGVAAPCGAFSAPRAAPTRCRPSATPAPAGHRRLPARASKRAAALGLRANVTMPRLVAPDRDVDAMAEPGAAQAAAKARGGRVEGRGLHGSILAPWRNAWRARAKRAPSASFRARCFRPGKQPGASAEAHAEVLRRTHEPRRCRPGPHDQNVRRSHSLDDRC